MSKITATMAIALSYMHEHGGVVVRHLGGFWADANWDGSDYIKESTIEALVKRGAIEYCEWKNGYREKFPVKAKLVESKPQ